MKHSGSGRLILALLACLACPIAGNALTCPPGEREEAGRCIPIPSPPHFENKIAPSFGREKGGGSNFERFEKKSGPGFHTGVAPDTETRVRPNTETAAPSAAPTETRHDAVRANRKATPSDQQLVPVRAYLRSSEIPPASIGAYGIVAFRARPTSASRSRLLMACAAYVASIPPQKSVPDSVSVSDEMLTIWPLDDPSSPEAAKDDCNFAIDHYDLYGGDSAIADAEKQGAKFGADGPFLIGWSPANSRGVSDKLVLVVDMSLYDSQDSFDQAFQFWKQKIVEDPTLWRKGFSIDGVRLAIRDFADHYGDTILSAAISVWKN
jgi:hypothetical protein